MDFNRAKYWIGVGAQPSNTVARLLRKAGILPPTWPSMASGPPLPERPTVEEAKAAPPRQNIGAER